MSMLLGCELVDAVDHKICAENHLLLKLQLLGPKIKLKVESRSEKGVEIFARLRSKQRAYGKSSI